MDLDEYEVRVARASAARTREELREAIGDVEPLEPVLASGRRRRGPAWGPALPVVVAVVVGALLLGGFVFGLHPAFLWIVPLVWFKAGRFHRWGRRPERTIPA